MAETNEVTYDIRVSRARLPADLAAAEREIVAAAQAAAQKAREQVRRTASLRFGVDEAATRNEVARVLRGVREQLRQQRVEIELGVRTTRGNLDAVERARFAATRGPGDGPVGDGLFVAGGAIAATAAATRLANSFERASGAVLGFVTAARSNSPTAFVDRIESREAFVRNIPGVGPLAGGVLGGSVNVIDSIATALGSPDLIRSTQELRTQFEGIAKASRDAQTALTQEQRLRLAAAGGISEVSLAARQLEERRALQADLNAANTAGATPEALAEFARANALLLERQAEERRRLDEDRRVASVTADFGQEAGLQLQREINRQRLNRLPEELRNDPEVRRGFGREEESILQRIAAIRSAEATKQLEDQARRKAEADQAAAEAAQQLRRAFDDAASRVDRFAQVLSPAGALAPVLLLSRRVADEVRARNEAARDAAQIAREQAAAQAGFRQALEQAEADQILRRLGTDSQAFAATDLRFINVERGATPGEQAKVAQSLSAISALNREQVRLLGQIAQAGVNLAILGP